MSAKHLLVILGLIFCFASRDLDAAEPANDADTAAKLLATEVCSVCHGPGGRSAFPAIPNLAAQQWPYLMVKMRAFRIHAGIPSEEHIDVLGLMRMDDATENALAHYFADQTPAMPVAGNAALIAAGAKLFTQGDPEHGIVACVACHGTEAAGLWIFPRLAGQRAEYVERQLRQIQSRLRDSRIMHGIIKNMTADQMKAMAAFVQSK